MKKLALVRVNYSQLYGVYDGGKTYKNRDILIPYQLLTLASSIRNRGVEVKIFDGEMTLATEEQLCKDILSWGPDFVGVTTTTPDIDINNKLCRLIKEAKPNIVTIIGGPHATAEPQDTAKNEYLNWVVVGDGEDALRRIVFEQAADGSKIIYGKTQDISEQPMPAHDLLDYANYKFSDPLRGHMPSASIMSTRGCPFTCIFCFHNRNLRYRRIDSFIEEIKYLYQNKDVRYFYIYDDTFFVNKKRVLEIAKRIKELAISDAYFQCLTRANLIDEEIIEALKSINLIRVSMGVESGSDEVLKLIKKGVKTEDYVRACDLLFNYGIETRGSFILGHPYETYALVQKTIEFSKSLRLFHANFNIMTPYPGTELYQMALEGKGIYFAKPDYAHNWSAYRRWGKAVIRTNTLSAQDLEQLQKQAQIEFYTQNKIYEHYYQLFKKGNNSRYFHRPLNFAWRHKFGKDVDFWQDLEEDEIIDPHSHNKNLNQS